MKPGWGYWHIVYIKKVNASIACNRTRFYLNIYVTVYIVVLAVS